jgi:hypothetical protein
VFDQFSDDSQDIGDKGFQSILCFTVNDTVKPRRSEKAEPLTSGFSSVLSPRGQNSTSSFLRTKVEPV